MAWRGVGVAVLRDRCVVPALAILSLSAWLAVGVAGCTTGTYGVLGVCTFHYDCLDGSDSACQEGSFSDPVPAKIALHARFGLAAHCKSDVELDRASPALASSYGGGWFGVHVAGPLAFVARSSPGVVQDLIHVHGAEIAAVQLWGLESCGWFCNELVPADSEIELAIGEPLSLVAIPVGETGERLAGALSYTWAADQDGVASAERAGDGSRTRVECLAAGLATYTVTWGEFSAAVEIQCVEAT